MATFDISINIHFTKNLRYFHPAALSLVLLILTLPLNN
jgi:hypothetical protein